MFKSLPRHWLPATFSQLLRDQPIQVYVADERLAVFRDAQGQAHALLDRCPHRGVALSQGKVNADGCLACPFHGWTFRGDGACVHVPFNPDARLEQLRATAVPVVEKGGIIWVYTDPSATDPGEPDVPEMLLQAEFQHRPQEVVWKTHWTRAMENMLDVPHLPYVHRSTIGRGMVDPLGRHDMAMLFNVDTQPYGFSVNWTIGGKPESGSMEWRKPCGMVLHISEGKRPFRQHVWCVPGRKGETRLMVISSQRLPWPLSQMSWFLNWTERIIIQQDKNVVESSDPPEVPPAATERSVATDKPTLLFRAWYTRTIAQNDSPPPEP